MAETPNKPSVAIEVDDNLADPLGALIGQVHLFPQEVNRCGVQAYAAVGKPMEAVAELADAFNKLREIAMRSMDMIERRAEQLRGVLQPGPSSKTSMGAAKRGDGTQLARDDAAPMPPALVPQTQQAGALQQIADRVQQALDAADDAMAADREAVGRLVSALAELQQRDQARARDVDNLTRRFNRLASPTPYI